MNKWEAAHKIIMEILLLIMEKSWNNHGNLISNFCGNPDECFKVQGNENLMT